MSAEDATVGTRSVRAVMLEGVGDISQEADIGNRIQESSMPRVGKGQRALDRAHQHREALERLLANADDLRDWFRDWAESQLRRDRFYILFGRRTCGALQRRPGSSPGS